MSIPTMYLEWFRARFPNHPLAKCRNSKELVMQSLRNIQGTKDAGFEWYQLLAKIFKDLGWKANSVCKGVWVYLKNDVKAYLLLATDDILYMSKSEGPLDALMDRFGDFIYSKERNKTSILKLQDYTISRWYIIRSDQSHSQEYIK